MNTTISLWQLAAAEDTGLTYRWGASTFALSDDAPDAVEVKVDGSDTWIRARAGGIVRLPTAAPFITIRRVPNSTALTAAWGVGQILPQIGGSAIGDTVAAALSERTFEIADSLLAAEQNVARNGINRIDSLVGGETVPAPTDPFLLPLGAVFQPAALRRAHALLLHGFMDMNDANLANGGAAVMHLWDNVHDLRYFQLHGTAAVWGTWNAEFQAVMPGPFDALSVLAMYRGAVAGALTPAMTISLITQPEPEFFRLTNAAGIAVNAPGAESLWAQFPLGAIQKVMWSGDPTAWVAGSFSYFSKARMGGGQNVDTLGFGSAAWAKDNDVFPSPYHLYQIQCSAAANMTMDNVAIQTVR